jgi:tetratricopeptide (TPR) repeat protein
MDLHHVTERIDHQFNAGRWNDAAQRLQDLLTTSSSSSATSVWRVGWLARLGRCALAAGTWTEAKRCTHRAETALAALATITDPDAEAGHDACLCLFAVLRDLGQMDAAERIVRRWIAETTGGAAAEALIHLGDLLADRGDRRTAIETLQAAIVQAGDDEDHADRARLSLAVVLEEAGRRAEARRHRDRALRGMAHRFGRDDPEYLQGLNSQAVSLLDAGRPLRAVPILRRAMRSAAGWERTMPDLLATIHRSLADALWDGDAPRYRWRPHRDAALRLTFRAMGPDSGESLQARCWAASFDEPQQGLAALEKILADSRRIRSLPAHLHAEILALIALKLDELGRGHESLEHFHRALALLPLKDREGMPPDVYYIAMNTILGLLDTLLDQAADDPASRDQTRLWLGHARRLAGDDVRFLSDIEHMADALAEIEADAVHSL